MAESNAVASIRAIAPIAGISEWRAHAHFRPSSFRCWTSWESIRIRTRRCIATLDSLRAVMTTADGITSSALLTKPGIFRPLTLETGSRCGCVVRRHQDCRALKACPSCRSSFTLRLCLGYWMSPSQCEKRCAAHFGFCRFPKATFATRDDRSQL